ncbi:MAG: T9SS type A sorting domain-containing protein [Flavobacteriales bacterium]|nr:T9SS type A sorting domain-containing protein [Flavobacteriales bacterium]MBL6873404.1 T9SS type A sorting domain-containing protein [Flavobacteriales bacterium]
MIMTKSSFSLLLSILLSTILFSQERVSPLKYNSQLSTISKKSISSVQSIVTLPFFDDFSNYKGYPKVELWQDKDVFVNNTYPINPVNIGVATFDGLDSLGNPINNASETAHGDADYLTSNPIDLSAYNNVYFSFLLQSTGYGNEPENNDELSVQFLDTALVWQTVWDTVGFSLSDFTKINYTISDLAYLHSDFQFRFHNMATLSGNFDHWHIDNVLLTDDINLLNDVEDVAFIYETSQMINFYYTIPWSHFDKNRAAYMSNNMDTWIRNNYSTAQSVDYRYDIYDYNDDLIFHYPSTGPTRNDEIPALDINFSYSDDSPTAITVETSAFPPAIEDLQTNSYTIIQSIATDDNSLFQENDTLRFTQVFDNYYALDDGTAEASYGINSEQGKVAMLFNIAEQDTLKAVQLHFEKNYEDSYGIAFRIKLWSSQSGEPSTELYESQIFYPEYTGTKNGFFEYVLENPIVVSGSVFVGWEQYSENIVNIGLDRNRVNNERMYYNLGGGWQQSNCADCDGTWMIRPVFGSLSTPSNSTEFEMTSFSIFPNPAKDIVYIDNDESFKLDIYSLSGKQLLSSGFITSQTIDVSAFSKGVYILKMTTISNTTQIEKLIIQ